MDRLLEAMMRQMGQIEQPNIETKETLASYYAPIFQPNIRTVEFLRIFGEIFGDDSSICMEMPRPLVCNGCTQKYIKNIETIIKYLNEHKNEQNIRILHVLETIILPRLHEVQELVAMVLEHRRASGETMNVDTIFDFLGIDMSKYDPPSEKVMEKCDTYDYVKTDDDNCVVCMCDFEEGDKVKKLICNHQFHEGCIMTWLKNNSTCPMCKASLKDGMDVEEVKLEPFNLLKTIIGLQDNRPQIFKDLQNFGHVDIFVKPDGTITYHVNQEVQDEMYLGTINRDNYNINIESDDCSDCGDSDDSDDCDESSNSSDMPDLECYRCSKNATQCQCMGTADQL